LSSVLRESRPAEGSIQQGDHRTTEVRGLLRRICGPIRSRTPYGVPSPSATKDRIGRPGTASRSKPATNRPPACKASSGRCCHLRGRGTSQVEAASWLSVVVCSGPLRAVVNGTLVARPARTTLVGPGSVGTSSAAEGGSSRVSTCLVGERPEGARRAGGRRGELLNARLEPIGLRGRAYRTCVRERAREKQAVRGAVIV
jgi:hypothetical protein